jgi:DNA topoisomerase III
MKVCIAEKPSVAKEIAAILGAKKKQDGYFEGNGYAVTWTFGHLCGLCEPDEYDSQWKWWKLESLPIIPQRFNIKLINNSGVKKQFNTIQKLVDKCEYVINCGDAGQEGELIQRWVLHKAKCKKPVKRLWISSLTEEAIKDGFKNLKPAEEFESLYHAGSSRAIGDWLLGINATRLYTIKYGKPKQLLSVGRVQTPTLAMIAEREKAIRDFKPEPFWELKTNYRDVLFSYAEGRFTEKEKCEVILNEITNQELKIDKVSIKKGKEAPPKLFDLTSLQVECNKRFGMSAEDTLNTVQKLYEKKMVTYPRVDTTCLPEDQYPKIPGIMNKLKGFDAFIAPLLSKKIRKDKRLFDNKKVTDHHAIIPTGVHTGALNNFENKIYDSIVRRFVAAFSDDCIVSNSVIEASVGKHPFKVNGKQILEPGWQAIYSSKEKMEDKNKDQLLPEFKKGESGPHSPEIQEKVTSPPKFFTEATLLRAMETAGKQVKDDELRELMKENGIGRPSTRAAIIETLFKRNYITKEKKNLRATETGIHLIDTIKNDLLKSAELTGQWEKKLRDIEKGEYDSKTFLLEMKSMVTGMVKEVKTGKKFHQVGADAKITCPKCNKGHLIQGKKAYGCSNWSKGCNFIIPFVFDGINIPPQVLPSLVKNRSLKLQGKNELIKINDNFELEKSVVG